MGGAGDVVAVVLVVAGMCLEDISTSQIRRLPEAVPATMWRLASKESDVMGDVLPFLGVSKEVRDEYFNLKSFQIKHTQTIHIYHRPPRNSKV